MTYWLETQSWRMIVWVADYHQRMMAGLDRWTDDQFEKWLSQQAEVH